MTLPKAPDSLSAGQIRLELQQGIAPWKIGGAASRILAKRKAPASISFSHFRGQRYYRLELTVVMIIGPPAKRPTDYLYGGGPLAGQHQWVYTTTYGVRLQGSTVLAGGGTGGSVVSTRNREGGAAMNAFATDTKTDHIIAGFKPGIRTPFLPRMLKYRINGGPIVTVALDDHQLVSAVCTSTTISLRRTRHTNPVSGFAPNSLALNDAKWVALRAAVGTRNTNLMVEVYS